MSEFLVLQATRKSADLNFVPITNQITLISIPKFPNSQCLINLFQQFKISKLHSRALSHPSATSDAFVLVSLPQARWRPCHISPLPHTTHHSSSYKFSSTTTPLPLHRRFLPTHSTAFSPSRVHFSPFLTSLCLSLAANDFCERKVRRCFLARDAFSYDNEQCQLISIPSWDKQHDPLCVLLVN
jgi:hypothetical protein